MKLMPIPNILYQKKKRRILFNKAIHVLYCSNCANRYALLFKPLWLEKAFLILISLEPHTYSSYLLILNNMYDVDVFDFNSINTNRIRTLKYSLEGYVFALVLCWYSVYLFL